ncbi:MAG TPA: amino acid adenylation domain-containing protein [Thermoanaerobaculia bacterium]|nr:amino acid adenylation domain-containing protein [Thermoanaerobaculia bacterium]
MSGKELSGNEIAIVGMAGRFPGARNLDQFWANLRDGVEGMRRLSEEELAALGVEPEIYRDPAWVPVVSQMEGFADFAADFFGINPREAETMDPQHRVLLECAWEALESAGYHPEEVPGAVGMFAGATLSTYLVYQLARNRRISRGIDPLQLILGNAGDAMTTRISYKLNLKGPSCAVQCACSTSLVAVHLACQSLLQEECDAALAGGVSVNLAHAAGYRYVEGSILSPDGRCRSFDADGRGTPFGCGVGLVVLKRLEDALGAGDTIRAVILGSAMNNDGSLKVGFTAPGVEGQARVIAEALAVSGVDPETIRYLEAHGSGTPLGDPVEVQAVTKAFRRFTDARGFCAMGSVKSNLGHLDTAAGVTGLIKTVLALEKGWIPPSLNFAAPNPKIDFAAAPIYVATKLQPWPEEPGPRRAGVNSFGAGGTNAHVVLEEAPPVEVAGTSRRWQILALSAQSGAALDAATSALADHLRRHPELHLEDVAHTLHRGRKAFAERRVAVCRDLDDAATSLESLDPTRVWTDAAPEELGERPVVFLLPGLGEHFVDMGLGLYQSEPAFRQALDRCAEALLPELGTDLREVFYPRGVAAEEAAGPGEGRLDLRRLLGRGGDRGGEDARRLDETRFAQPALFAVEYALAQLFLSWGIRPAALLGYSVGEYVAACLAGVLSLEDALKLVARRALWIQELPRGAMTAVPLATEEVEPLLPRYGLSLAARNGHAVSVVSGREEDVAALERELSGRGVVSRRLPTTHAFHSHLLQPVAERLTELAASLDRRPPEIPYLSNVTGTWITAEQAVDPGLWARHMCGPVRFAEAVEELVRDGSRVYLEVGPGQGLGSLVRLHPGGDERARRIIPAMPAPQAAQPSQQVALGALGRLWLAGVRVDHDAFYAGRRRRRVPLPTYPFERRRFWVEPDREDMEGLAAPRLSPPPSADLPAAGHQRPAHVRTGYVAPQGEVEKAIAGMWEDLLGIAQAGRGDSFYELGGHSLLATQLASRLRELFAVDLQVGHLLEEPTVAAMAAVVRRRRDAASAAARAPRLERRWPARHRAPLSFSQERMWFLNQLDPGTVSYHIFFAVRLLGPLDAPALGAAFGELVRRHENLRTTFVREDGGPVQVIGPPQPVDLPLADLAGLPAAARQAEVHRLSEVEKNTPFDFERGPLLRLHLLRESERDHVLLMATHHLVGDGWSLLVLVREMAALYEAFAAGRPSPLPELPIQYADFAVWQRHYLSSEALEELLGYWRRQLADPPPPLHLETDHPRSAATGFRSGWAVRALEPELALRVHEAGRTAGASPFMILTAALQALLYRHTGAADVVIGAPIAGRNYGELEGLIGLFLNTLPLRLRLDPRRGFGELAAQVRQVTLEGYNHQDVPLELLLESAVERRPGLGSLFQVMILHQNVPIPEMELGELSLRPLPDQDIADLGANPFDLCLVVEEEGELRLSLLYNRNLFAAATAEALVERLRTLLAAGLAEPGQAIGELPLLSAAERLQLAAWSGAGESEPAGEVTVLDLFAEQVTRTPDAPAILAPMGTLTYRELALRADRLARHLQRLGAGPEVAVGLCLERSPEALVALLGILRSGGACVPLDPAQPAERTAAILTDVGAPLVVASRARFDRSSCAGIHLVDLLDLADLEGETPAPPPARTPGDRHTAYILYTSGSTGRPKGVAVEHRSLARFTLAARRTFALGPGDRVLQFAALTFDASGEEIYPALAAGAALVLRSAEMLASAAAFLAFCRDWRVTVADLPTAWWHQLTGALAAEDRRLGPPLRLLILGGERALAEKLIAGEARMDPSVRLLNTYGPTETTIAVTAWELPYGTAARLAGREVPIGLPFPHSRGWVLDPAGGLAPAGFPGELHVGGAAPARGYFDRPELTAASFVPDAFSGIPGARLYRTGDRVRFLPDGQLEFLGRVDEQVKIRGFRVEPGEVEAALRSCPGVTEALVMAREDTPGERRLVAYVVAAEPLDPSALRGFLAARVPEYMLPAAFVPLERLPLNASGKVDRRTLPPPEQGTLGSKRPHIAPRNPTEELLAGLFAEVLSVDRVSVEDSFFELGGHSLSLVQLFDRVREAFQVEVSLRAVYDDPTVAGLADAVEELILADIKALG